MTSSRTSGNDTAAPHCHHPWAPAGSNPRRVHRMVPPQDIPPVGRGRAGGFVCRRAEAGIRGRQRRRAKILAQRLGKSTARIRRRHSNHGGSSQHPSVGGRLRHRAADRALCQALGEHRTSRAAEVFLRAVCPARHRAVRHRDHRRHFQPVRLHGDRGAVQLRADRLRQRPRLHGGV